MSVPGRMSVEAARPPSPWLIPTLALAVTISMLTMRSYLVFIPVMADDLGVSVPVMGQVPALMLLVAGVLALVAGPLADRFGFRLTLVVGLITVFLSTVASGLAPTVQILVAVTLVGAVARASVLPTAQAAAVTAFADENARRRAIGWVSTGLSVASIAGIPLMTFIAGLSSWRVSFVLVGGLALVVAVMLQLTMRPAASRATGAFNLRALLASYAPLRRHRPTLMMMLASLVGDMGAACGVTYVAAFFVQRHGFSIEQAGWLFLVIGSLAFCGAVFAGRVRVAPRSLLIGGRLALGLGLMAAMTLPVSWPVSVGLLLLGAWTLALADVTTTLVLNAVSPAGRGTTLSLRSSTACIGSALGAAIGGVMLVLGDYAAVGVCTLALMVVCAGLVWLARPRPTLATTVPIPSAA